MASWSISVKTVGGLGLTNTTVTVDGAKSPAAKPSSSTNFTVHVAPTDSLLTLHKHIESVTGLKASQQRLIYRGKLISSGAEADTRRTVGTHEGELSLSKIRVCDIEGLDDGQTIHLVPKPSTDSSSDTNRGTNISNAETDYYDPGSTITGDVGAGLLSALLGLGTTGMIPVQAGEIDLSDIGSLRQSRAGTRAARSVARRRRLNAHRRVATDPKYPPLAPLEPVRQGLMTLHTMIESQNRLNDTKNSHPLESPRHFYRGQWIDARDTVNTWCEATIVEVLSPDEILKIPASLRKFNKMDASSTSGKRRMIVPPSDSAVAANDIEGRRRLLLEPCENSADNSFLANFLGDESLKGFQERCNNERVQILLIHYNGWPHRWDEWIRSDSERIRPFRTRSKIPMLQSSNCPVPQNSFESAPSTHITKKEDALDRPYVIPELHRALIMVSDLFRSAIDGDANTKANGHSTLSRKDEEQSTQTCFDNYDLHKDRSATKHDVSQNLFNILPWLNMNQYHDQVKNDLDEVEKTDESSFCDEANIPTLRYNKRKLELLAPLLDRLGRVLLDTAPHIAALAEAIPEIDANDAELDDMNPSAQVGTPSASLTDPLLSGSYDEDPDSLISDDVTDTMHIDPDHYDFVNGFVNFLNTDGVPTTNIRRNVRSASSTAIDPSMFHSRDDENAPPGAGARLIRLNGGNATNGVSGGGIDIHIHAIVTGAGVGGGFPFMSGISNLMSESSSSPRPTPINTTNQLVQNPSSCDEDDLGLFSDLYSDAPSMVTTTHDALDINRHDYDSSDHITSDIGTTDLNHLATADGSLSSTPSFSDLMTVDSSPTGDEASCVESETQRGTQLVNSETQTTSPVIDGVERQSPRSSLALRFRRALGRSCR